MNVYERNGIRFGFGLILIWLVILTSYVMYDKIKEEERIDTIILPPQLELLEVDIEGGNYDIQSNF